MANRNILTDKFVIVTPPSFIAGKPLEEQLELLKKYLPNVKINYKWGSLRGQVRYDSRRRRVWCEKNFRIEMDGESALTMMNLWKESKVGNIARSAWDGGYEKYKYPKVEEKIKKGRFKLSPVPKRKIDLTKI